MNSMLLQWNTPNQLKVNIDLAFDYSEIQMKWNGKNNNKFPDFVNNKNSSDKFYDLTSTAVIAITNKRILIGQKRVVWGYFLSSITPDLYNDMQVYQGLIWGKITIDTVKEVLVITNISKDSLREIETEITEFMMEEKKKYIRSLSE